MAFYEPRLVVEPLERCELFLTSELRVLHCRFQHLDGLIVDPKGHRKRMPVLAAMRKGEARRVREAVRRPMHDLGNHRQGAHGPRSHAWNEEQFGEIDR